MSKPTLEDLREANAVLTKRLLRRREDAPRVATFDLRRAKATAKSQVHAVGIGRKYTDGKRTSVRCVRIHVLQKLALSAIPKAHRLPEEIDGIPTDVVAAPHAFLSATACGVARDRHRPLRPGVSVGGRGTTFGTLGCFVRNRSGDPRILLLSCSHVLADRESELGDAVFQPAIGDGGTAVHRVAELTRFTPVLGRAKVSEDAAVAALRDGVTFDPEVCSLVQPQGSRAPELMLPVRKRGRASAPPGSVQIGFIADQDFNVKVAVPGGGVIVYRNQMRIEPSTSGIRFSVPGDSGSLVLEAGGPRAVGLLVGGDPGGSYSLATPIKRVLDRLRVDLV